MKFVDLGKGDWKTNPGKSANYYHSLFSEKIGHNTLEDIATASQQGAIIDTSHFGFHPRNNAVASRATHMIALTWSETGTPTDGGTLYTWKRCSLDPRFKAHISLKELE